MTQSTFPSSLTWHYLMLRTHQNGALESGREGHALGAPFPFLEFNISPQLHTNEVSRARKGKATRRMLELSDEPVRDPEERQDEAMEAIQ